MTKLSDFPCPNCQIGICRATHTTYVTIFEGMFISAPNTPVWQCDICQYQEFERQAINRLETLLGLRDSPVELPRSTPKVASIDVSESTTARRVKP